jgi:hypothetical protein
MISAWELNPPRTNSPQQIRESYVNIELFYCGYCISDPEGMKQLDKESWTMYISA